MSGVARAVDQLTERKVSAGFGPPRAGAPRVTRDSIRTLWVGLDLDIEELEEVAKTMSAQAVAYLLTTSNPPSLIEYMAGLWMDAFSTGVFYEREIREPGE